MKTKQFLLIVKLMILFGCSPSQQANVTDEKMEELQTEVEELKKEKTELLDEIDELKKQIRTLREQEIDYTTKITWQNYRINQLEQAYKETKMNVVQEQIQYEPVYAEFVGLIDEVGVKGEAWFKAETKFTELYFHGEAVKMEYMKDHADQMFEYILTFLGETWEGEKLRIYFTDGENLFGNEEFLGYYEPLTERIWIAPDFTMIYSDEYGDFLLDPRDTVLHEMFHAISNFDQGLPYEDYWFEEGMASYLALRYDYQPINAQSFPEAYEYRLLYDVYWFDYANGSFQTAIHDEQELNQNWSLLTAEEKKEFFSLKGIARLHYGDSFGISISFFEASIIDALIDFYGQDRTLSFYQAMKNVETSLDVEVVFEEIFQVTLSDFEHQWKKRIQQTGDVEENMY